MPLSDAACKNAKPLEKPYKLGDAGGLYLLVKPNGSRLWQMKYRINGKEKTLSLGVYPEVTLAEARSGRDNARKLVAVGRGISFKSICYMQISPVRYQSETFAIFNPPYLLISRHASRSFLTRHKREVAGNSAFIRTHSRL